MAIGRGELQQMAYVLETAYGTTPGTPTMLELWNNTESMRPNRQPFESGRSLGDRQISDVRMGRKSGSGDILSELCFANFDDFIFQLLGTDVATGFPTPFSQIAASTISTTEDGSSDGGTIDDSGSGMGAVSVGDTIVVAGFTEAANNAVWRVTVASASSLTVVPVYTGQSALVTEAAGDSVTIDQVERVENSTDEDSFTIELLYTDLTRYHVYTGCMMNTAAITIPPNGIVTCNWGVIAKNYAENGSSLGTPTAATLYSPFDGLSGTYQEAGVASSVMTGITLNLNNNITLTEALGSDEAGEAIPRKFRVDGNIAFYKEDDTISAKFYAETESSIVFTLSDPSSNQYRVTIPRIKYTSLEEGKGDDGPLISRLNFMALKDADTGKMIYWDKL